MAVFMIHKKPSFAIWCLQDEAGGKYSCLSNLCLPNLVDSIAAIAIGALDYVYNFLTKEARI